MLRRLRKDQAGFTLMEIVIVIVILGILALLAVPRLIGFTDQAKIANDKEYAAIVGKSAELYWASHNETFTNETLSTAYTAGTSQIQTLVDDPDLALQFFTVAAAVTISVDSSTNSLTVNETTDGVDLNGDGDALDAALALDTGVALVTITEGTNVIQYSSQYGYSQQP